jgi:pimeloyl-ACP methyl ester carboxylesterase
MARQRINDIELYYELTGDGDDTVVLVHGSWTDHSSWQLVAPALAEQHRVLTYDRRGHSRSDRPSQATRHHDEDDLAGLIEALDLGAVHLVGNSYGGSISLGLAARRPDLVRSVTAHEPPLLGVARPGTTLADELRDVESIVREVAELLRAGQLESAARHFVEQAVFGPGTWQLLPDGRRRTFVANAEMFLQMLSDPKWDHVPRPVDVPLLLTDGDASPSWLPAIVAALASTEYPDATRHTFRSAGHAPHLTHPDSYVDIVESFLGGRIADHSRWSATDVTL